LTPAAQAFIFRPPMKLIPTMTRKQIETTILIYLVLHFSFFLVYTVKVCQMMGLFGGM
jgi:hypothetical protein